LRSGIAQASLLQDAHRGEIFRHDEADDFLKSEMASHITPLFSGGSEATFSMRRFSFFLIS
jgi:hypothetical protein